MQLELSFRWLIGVALLIASLELYPVFDSPLARWLSVTSFLLAVLLIALTPSTRSSLFERLLAMTILFLHAGSLPARYPGLLKEDYPFSLLMVLSFQLRVATLLAGALLIAWLLVQMWKRIFSRS